MADKGLDNLQADAAAAAGDDGGFSSQPVGEVIVAVWVQ
jgi:nicotinamide mononucleotide (NMN) deamidase PncC